MRPHEPALVEDDCPPVSPDGAWDFILPHAAGSAAPPFVYVLERFKLSRRILDELPFAKILDDYQHAVRTCVPGWERVMVCGSVTGDPYRFVQLWRAPSPLALAEPLLALRARGGPGYGYFERVPAVWHKEILFAMSRGVHVFGAASMGALRAAELGAFGMEGVGAVHASYTRGEIDADDEVAVAHAAAEDGHRPLSEALVNIRATLRAAETAGVIGAGVRASVERTARGLFYPDRCYPILLRHAEEQGVAPADLDALRAFLPAGRVDQKRLDALEMLRVMRARLSDRMEPKRARWRFEHTDAWEHMQRSIEQG